jgi:hypothetical protein
MNSKEEKLEGTDRLLVQQGQRQSLPVCNALGNNVLLGRHKFRPHSLRSLLRLARDRSE